MQAKDLEANDEEVEETPEPSSDNNPFISKAKTPDPAEPGEAENAESSFDLLSLGRELLAREAERAELNQQAKSPAAAGPSPLHALLFEDVDASDPLDVA